MSEAAHAIVLELNAACPEATAVEAPMPAADLRLRAGDLALLDAPDPVRAQVFTGLCTGLLPLASGSVRFLGRDWAELPRDRAAELRGRIGHVFGEAGWMPHLTVADGILLPQLHHTSTPEATLRDRAAELARHFGLPGLPLARPAELPAEDLARAACVRAFQGQPALLLLEHPLRRGLVGELLRPLLDAVAGARMRGTACIWLTGSRTIWSDPSIPATHRLRLSARGLSTTGRDAT